MCFPFKGYLFTITSHGERHDQAFCGHFYKGSNPSHQSRQCSAPHSSTLAWKIPWKEEPGRLQSMGSWRVRHDWATSLSLSTFMHWRRKWQPTPVFLPGESQGCPHRVGHDWSDLAAVAILITIRAHTCDLITSQKSIISVFPGDSGGKEAPCNAEDLGSIPGLGRSPGKGNGYPFQYSYLENSMDRRVCGVAKSWTQPSN